MTSPNDFDFDGLRMYVSVDENGTGLFVSIASGFVDFEVRVPLNEKDLQVLQTDSERSAFLQAALHQPFQLRQTALSEIEQRKYLDIILHSSVAEVETFLTTLDHGSANGAISNMLRITRGRNQQTMRSGRWFA
ncbi:MAG: hypothetical protein QE495_15090 [Acidovorax sp.]|uniref:hypothetical protein n=1 Tax=Acidovorax sp. TaxID=1872122 RepID=UPI0026137B3C|nr:hypothetical protein [Acidovorax sp.]MDH4427778.1 hypothetical protein [Acidovorax sp.]